VKSLTFGTLPRVPLMMVCHSGACWLLHSCNLHRGDAFIHGQLQLKSKVSTSLVTSSLLIFG